MTAKETDEIFRKLALHRKAISPEFERRGEGGVRFLGRRIPGGEPPAYVFREIALKKKQHQGGPSDR